MNAPIEMIKQLRGATGAGVMECRRALEQSSLDYDAAFANLLETAAIKAKNKSGRAAQQGRLELYAHNNGRIGVMVEINTETEFASHSEAFRQFAHEIALQVTCAAPLYVRDEEIPQEILDEQAQAAAETARRAGKPERLIEKIVEGVLDKYKTHHVLLRQAYIRDDSMTVDQLLNQAIGRIGENIVIRRFVRWEICPEAE